MAGVSISSLRKEYGGGVAAVDGVSLDVADGEMLVLLGPSGCGKTTTLRCLAGLEDPTAGSIHFGERTVFDRARRVDLPPEKRDVGMVFQSYALWPHKTVAENIAYPLKARRLKRELREEGWVGEAARAVGCEGLLDRYPGQLSGGQQQRVALARALVARPAVVLFDEPLSNLDARLRDSVRSEIHEIHRRLGFTGVYVTHDQSEAFALGDRLAVMRSGRIEQLGAPREIYERPATEYVAGFVGFVNRIPLAREPGGGWASESAPIRGYEPPTAWRAGRANLRTRPEDLRVHQPGRATGAVLGPARVVDHSYGGRHLDVVVELGSARLRAHYEIRAGDAAPVPVSGDAVELSFDPERALLFPEETEEVGVAAAPSDGQPARSDGASLQR